METIQFLSDNHGNRTAVVIPISDWNKLTEKYTGLENDVVSGNIPEWHQPIVDQRLQHYLQNPDDVTDFETLCQEIEQDL